MSVLDLLKKSGFFQDLSEENKNLLQKLWISRKFNKNEHVFLEGDSAKEIYLVSQGSIQLYKTNLEGKEAVIKIVSEGELFAEVVLFEQDKYPVNALSLSKCHVYALPKEGFMQLLDDISFRNDFIKTLMKKQRYLADRIFYLTSFDVEARFFRFLTEQHGISDKYNLSISKKNLASAIGTNPETLSRLFARLQKEQKILLEDKTLYISNPDLLKNKNI